MNADAYLRRITYSGSFTPTTSCLHALHAAHMVAVPFENLDIPLGRPIVLSEDALFAKIVGRRRGGFCYELNGLFAALLRQAGFAVTLLSAGVARAEGGFGPPFDHLALRVETEERWLVDVGFGDSFVLPLRLDDPRDQVHDHGVFRVSHDGSEWTVLRQDGPRWAPQFRFTLQPSTLGDFAARCLYHQTSPDSSFTQGSICSRATPEGRITLADLRLIVTRHGEKSERTLPDEVAYHAALQEHFGIVLP